MPSPVEAVLTTDNLGLGGTEKGLVDHAIAFDPANVRCRVVTHRALGPRTAALAAAGIPYACAHADVDRLARLLAGAQLVHVFRIGLSDPMLPEAVRRAGVPHLVETNVFGAIDSSPDEAQFDMHLFVGRMCALRYRERLNLSGPQFHRRHRVSHWPLNLEHLRSLAPATADAKLALGLDPARPVVGRVGRDDDRKWRNLLVDAAGELVGLDPSTQVLFVGTTPAKRKRIARRGFAASVTSRAPTSDEALLATFYAACDVVIMAAEIGESFSVALSEAMALGRPVVTCSTPWVDNGQIEQVDHGVTGYVANHPLEMAQAVKALFDDADLRERMGAAASAKADRLQDVHVLTRQLEQLFADLVAGREVRGEWLPSSAEVDAFASEYQARLRRHFRPLSAAERAHVNASRWVERATWAGRAASNLDARSARMVAGLLRSKAKELRSRSG